MTKIVAYNDQNIQLAAHSCNVLFMYAPFSTKKRIKQLLSQYIIIDNNLIIVKLCLMGDKISKLTYNYSTLGNTWYVTLIVDCT